MKTTIEFLDELKARKGGISDYAVAKILGVTQQTISKYRVGKDYLGDSTAIRVAELLEINPAIVVSAVHAERSKSEQEKAVWREIFEKLGGVAASVVIGIAAYSLPVQPVQASSVAADPMYILFFRYPDEPHERLVCRASQFEEPPSCYE